MSGYIARTMDVHISYIALVLVVLHVAVATPTQNTENQATFSSELFNAVAKDKIQQNVIISPASIQTCLALAYFGAKGTTADELKRGLHLGGDAVTKTQVAQKFGNLNAKMRSTERATIKMANRIYVKEGYQIAPAFNEVAQRYFGSDAENVDFVQKEATAAKINRWIEQHTQNKIRDLISPNGLDASTAAILVNAIYFKATWINTFDSYITELRDFHSSKTTAKKVHMMYQQDGFAYAELTDLDAKALSMRYIGTDIQMLVLLPNKLDGLSRLEDQLKDIDLTKLKDQLKRAEVRVTFPKFKLEFEISLKSTLETLGIREVFTPRADFSDIFSTREQVAISEVKHKAFIEVNEEGTEAAAGTAIKMMFMSLQRFPKIYDFNADHPFYFAILDNEAVYFAGHVVDI